MTKSNAIKYLVPLFFLVVALAVTINCGGGGGGGGSSEGTGVVRTTITDPPICQAPAGPFEKVWVTITRVRAHISDDASPDGGGWVDLVDLRDEPRQIDLLSLATTTCILTELGTSGELPVGKYQQIRLYLLSNDPDAGEATPLTNECGVGQGYNCVELEGGSIQMLLLSSQAQTGIKIPPGQIEGGGLTVTADQVVDLNIDFDACSSIVLLGNGGYRLKPTLRAGEVSINNGAITGRVVEQGTTTPIANAIVLLERRDLIDTNIDRVISQRLTGPDGTFVLCALSTGIYDVVVAAKTVSGAVTKTYNATVTLDVPLGTGVTNMGDIPLTPEPGTSLPATISGSVSTSGASQLDATESDVVLTALQPVSAGALLVTVPLFNSTSSSATVDTGDTVAPSSCGYGCANFSLEVPASTPRVGTYSAAPPISYVPTPGAIVYAVSAQAFKDDLANCSDSNQIFPGIVVQPGVETTISAIEFTGCRLP